MMYKLLNHADGIVNTHPVSLSISPTGKCNLNCDFCYIKNRSKNTLDLDVIKHVINQLPSLKSVELGMGEPTLYPQINELIEWLVDKNIAIGLSTNGLNLDKIDSWQSISWVILALTHSIDKEERFKEFKFPTHVHPVYVINKNTPEPSILKILLEEYNKTNKWLDKIEVKIDINCNDQREWHILRCLKEISGDLFDYTTPRNKFKPYRGSCPYVYLKPLLHNDGWIYGCCIAVENYDYPKWNRICRWDEITLERLNQISHKRDCPKCSKVERINIINDFLDDYDPEFII